jgi:activator of HSP90 ATPase
MKKVFLVFLMLLILGMAATAGAQDRHHKGGNKRHNWSHSAYNQKSWHHTPPTNRSTSNGTSTANTTSTTDTS